MILEQLPLARQLDLVFRELREELAQLTSGTVFVQIRNNMVGKFGIRHFPLESKGTEIKMSERGLSESQQHSFRQTALESLKLKRWTHGEIQFEFAMRQDLLCTSVTFESNYNMANLVSESNKNKRDY
ncbi:O-methyltransferase [Paenibacillus sp. MZ04-78.2]|uniref:O-methyltransferase n=1 Tax=Paenibacillus sp. MZ04-78.2 TaxID=2962034 RepID=UPI0020B86670|nr:O-methyltransferase [Paenibacillus sp. MZ04-78.2]MCP3773814.1 O-methyltransferase [Paenibacillus sp. MZ04-78.2]